MILGWDPRLHSTSASVGELLANCEGKLMDDDGLEEVPPGQRGELWCRAPNVMKGYWKNPKATKETITEDGWLKTGDIAYADERGMYHIVDRKKVRTTIKCYPIGETNDQSEKGIDQSWRYTSCPGRA